MKDRRENLAPPGTSRQIAEWSDPPVSALFRTHGKSHYRDVVRELLAHPRRWARLTDRQSESAAYQFGLAVQRGRIAGFSPPNAFEVVWEGCAVWVRYVGIPSGSPVEFPEPLEGDDPADVAGEEPPAPEYTDPAEPVNRVNPERLFSF